jgi:hypothetical protein
MATKRKATRKAAKKGKGPPRPAKAKPARKAATPRSPGEREIHYTDLRKVMLANALKRLK